MEPIGRHGILIGDAILINKFMKKIIIIILLILIFLCALLLIIKSRQGSSSITPLVKPTITQKPFITPSGETMEVDGVEINNIYKTPVKETPQFDALIVNNEKYQIAYLQQFQKFLITILDPNFKETQVVAEKDFLDKLSISSQDACKLSVEISTPRSVNEDLAGKIFPLSFCTVR